MIMNSNQKQILNNVMNEELPVGKGSGANIAEYPEGIFINYLDFIYNE